MKYIYLFHMPMFAFVTGFFSKDVEKNKNNAVRKVLIPYVVLQCTYVIIATIMIKLHLATFNSNAFNYSIILPSSAFYYLLATFIWKVFSKDLLELNHPLMVAVLLGLTISFTKGTDFHIGYGAVFSLLPFFTMGILSSEEQINKLRRMKKIIGIVILLLGIIPAHFFPYAIHSIRFTYENQGFSNIEGLLWRLVYYIIATLMMGAIIIVTSDKNSIISKIGKHSIVVYAFSTFLSPSLYVLFDKIVHISRCPILNFFSMIIFCVFIILVASINWINEIFSAVIGFIAKILLQSDKSVK